MPFLIYAGLDRVDLGCVADRLETCTITHEARQIRGQAIKQKPNRPFVSVKVERLLLFVGGFTTFDWIVLCCLLDGSLSRLPTWLPIPIPSPMAAAAAARLAVVYCCFLLSLSTR